MVHFEATFDFFKYFGSTSLLAFKTILLITKIVFEVCLPFHHPTPYDHLTTIIDSPCVLVETSVEPLWPIINPCLLSIVGPLNTHPPLITTIVESPVSSLRLQ